LTSKTELLAQMVDRLGLQEVARQTGYSKGAICHALRGTYKGRTDKILQAVENAYSHEPVECPVLGEIPLSRCVAERGRPFAAVNPTRVALFRACRQCGRSVATSGDDHDQ
jgi:hypothetical protein